MLLLLAAQVAPALEAARLYATSNVERQHEQALREITQALAANLDERQVLDLAVGYGASMLKAPVRADLADRGDRRAELRRRRRLCPFGHLRPTAGEREHVRAGGPPTDRQPGQCARRARLEIQSRVRRAHGLGAYLGAGLWRAGQSLGVLEVMRDTGHRFNGVEEQLLVSLANAVAVAVSNARNHAAVERLAHEAEQRAEAVVESELLLRSVYEAIGSGRAGLRCAGQRS